MRLEYEFSLLRRELNDYYCGADVEREGENTVRLKYEGKELKISVADERSLINLLEVLSDFLAEARIQKHMKRLAQDVIFGR